MGKPASERSKVVIKNLPPLLPQDVLVSAIDAVCVGKYKALRYVPGRQRYATCHATESRC